MRRIGLLAGWLYLIGLLAAWAASPSRPEKVLLDRWYERKTPQGKIGYVHLLVRETERDGQKLLHSVQTDQLKYLRSGDVYAETDAHETWETPQGKIIELRYRTPLGKNQFLVVRGTPTGEEIRLDVLDDKTGATTFSVTKPWNPAALGLYAQELFLLGKDLTPGRSHTYHYFQTSMNAVVPTTVTATGKKRMTAGGAERDLIVLTQTFPRELYFDPTTVYVDARTGIVVRTEEDSTIFEKVIQELSTREEASRGFEAQVKDAEAPIGVTRPIQPFRLMGPRELVVVVRHSADDDIAGVFVAEARQQVLRRDGKEAELRLLAPRAIHDPAAEPRPGPEYLESNFYIRWDLPEVKDLAKKIVGAETEPRKQLKLIRTWVNRNVKGHYEVPFATADEVARTREGDCTEMGCLAAALGRAVGIPTRVAFGLVYDQHEPGFGGHLWTEAYLDGRWEAWDPTGVLQGLGAAYLKVGGYSLAGVLNPDELTSVRRAFAGKMIVEIKEVK